MLYKVNTAKIYLCWIAELSLSLQLSKECMKTGEFKAVKWFSIGKREREREREMETDSFGSPS
jgi:hypothetical protein